MELTNYEEGLLYFGEGQYKKALECFDKSLEQGEASKIEALSLKGCSLIKLDNLEGAIECFDSILDTENIDPEITAVAYDNKATCLCIADKFEEGLELYDKAMEADPTYINAISNKFLTLTKLNRFDDARALIRGKVSEMGEQSELANELVSALEKMRYRGNDPDDSKVNSSLLNPDLIIKSRYAA